DSSGNRNVKMCKDVHAREKPVSSLLANIGRYVLRKLMQTRVVIEILTSPRGLGGQYGTPSAYKHRISREDLSGEACSWARSISQRARTAVGLPCRELTVEL